MKNMLNMGIDRCIIGTKAVKEPEFIKELIQKFGAEAFVVGIDAKKGMVAVEGWGEVSNVLAKDLAMEMVRMGVKHIVYTDILRDGMLSGPNVEYTKLLTDQTGIEIIASGGMSSMDDLENLHNAGVKGAIIGKALYEKKIDLAEAIKKYE